MEHKTDDRRSALMIVSAMLIFGTIGVFRRNIPVSSAFLAFSRGILGGLSILLYTKLKRKEKTERIPFRMLAALAFTGALIGINWIFLFEAFSHTTVAVATLCYYMAPTIVMLLSPVLFREKLTGKKAACAAVAIIGMVFVSGAAESGGLPDGSLRGVLEGLGAAVFYACVVIMNKKIRGIDAYRKTTVQMLSAGAVMIPYLLLTNGFSADSFTPEAVFLLLAVGIVHTGIAYVLYFGSIDGLRVQTVAILSYIDPVSALLFSAFLLRERLTVMNLIGAVLIIGSAVVSEIQKTEDKAEPQS